MDILIAEDDSIVRRALKEELEKKGYDVLEADNGRQALDLFMEKQMSVVITDWMMPEMDGLELCRRIRGVSSGQNYTFIILMTSNVRISDLVEGFNAGADDYITKPFVPVELFARVRAGIRLVKTKNEIRDITRDLEQEVQQKTAALELSLKELKLNQARLLQADKLSSLGQIAGGMVHELKRPLGSIKSNIKIMQEFHDDYIELMRKYSAFELKVKNTGPLSEQKWIGEFFDGINLFKEQIGYDQIKDEFVEILDESFYKACSITEIADNLKEIAKAGSGDQESVDINRLIERSIVVINTGPVDIVVSKDFSSVSSVKGCLQSLNHVFMGLLINAVQAIEGKGTITISTRDEGDFVEVVISDTGCGIPADVLPKIFNPFYSTKDAGEGTGIGLYVADNVIADHKGSICVESQEGQGAMFTVRLPVARDNGFQHAGIVE